MDRKPTRRPVGELSTPGASSHSLPPTSPTSTTRSRDPLDPGPYQDEDPPDDLPPSYTGPTPSATPINSRPPPPPSSIPGSIPIDFSLYRIPGATLSKDLDTLTITDPAYSISAPALLKLLRRHAKLPPHPQIRITGKGALSYNPNSTDFDIRISMLRYFVHPPDSGDSAWNFVTLLNDSAPGWRGGREPSTVPIVKGGLEEWVARYVGEPIKEKSFTLTKTVTNWNTTYLEGQIRNLIASTGYKGDLSITFPVTHSKLVVESVPARPWYQALAAVFQPNQTRRFEVMTAVWPYAALAPEEAHGSSNQWAVKSEMQFWAEWKDVLHAAVLDRKRGWLTLEDHIEWAMGVGWEGKSKTGLIFEDGAIAQVGNEFTNIAIRSVNYDMWAVHEFGGNYFTHVE
ncbi:hypothetical protein BT63DRAFT_481091 [Microthyrium microscopicum]|uniref:Uncharacterized protein n=1 Tax=Microthyrium microscopicum TaxID=703497 RepID=A0A6A6U6L9_9PEZI|nr:hypothetical protein BT63DRAFT_481091 [Microthyrium microscopicum]